MCRSYCIALSVVLALLSTGCVSAKDVIACSIDTQPRVLTDPTGTFTTENHPANYPDNAECRWLIVAQEGQIVRLDFDVFNTERGYDRVWIHDGDSLDAPVLVGYDGDRSPAPTGIFSSGKNMFVRFTSDVSNNAAGFSANFASVDPVGIEDACAPLFRPLAITGSSSGQVMTPYFPTPYPFGINCQWLVTAPEENGLVKLDFTNFFTEPNTDWVTIYDGSSTNSPLLARLSGAYQPPPTGFQTTQRNMLIHFAADLAVSVRGFNATYTAVPVV